ncbi:AAA family ATPase [bacterium F11]|nr:AAA family ATPase [bacterium F11]
MDLFQIIQPKEANESAPLGARMAPRDWGEFVGQEHLVNSESPLRRAIEVDRLGSSIFFGPPGSGKTALARMAAKKSHSAIEFINAVTGGVPEIRQVVRKAIERKRIEQKRTLLIIDEIHHFNRSQQDALLPDVEKGNLTLIGLTTENPYFYVNAALMSRSTAFEFKMLNDENLDQILEMTLNDEGRGYGEYQITLLQEARKHFLRSASGDARRLLNNLEWAVLSASPSKDKPIIIDLALAEQACQKRSIKYDKKGDEHYDIISAFIKSLRGSDPDAALYWMAKMLMAGEDPRFIARRLMIFAAEDVGNADPRAVTVVSSVAQIIEMIGMPEARIPLSQAVTFLATAPKSNASYLAINRAYTEVEKGPIRRVPDHLKDSARDGKSLGHGQNYLYPHNFPDHHVRQLYMPTPKVFYEPTTQGYEAMIRERLQKWRNNNSF